MVLTLVNETPFAAAWTMGTQVDGRETIVVAVKATYRLDGLDAQAKSPLLAEEQLPLLMQDELGAEPATSAPVLENDFAPIKPHCDVLLVGSAHAPMGKRVPSLFTRLEVGPISKTIRVLGPRVWSKLVGSLSATSPLPFESQPISYDVAFGGTDTHPEDPSKISTYLENPVGKGFRKYRFDLDGVIMPSTEETDREITSPSSTYRPMSYGPIGRNWKPRSSFAGTYDQTWLDGRAPLWPLDFDTRYFQAAPPDQMMPFPRGGEAVELVNLVPVALNQGARLSTKLPANRVAIAFFSWRDEAALLDANLDTIVFLPERNRFTCTWRVAKAMTRDIFDLQEIVVGERESSFIGRMRARAHGKTYFPGLGTMADENARKRRS
jgi:hypothetical protein